MSHINPVYHFIICSSQIHFNINLIVTMMSPKLTFLRVSLTKNAFDLRSALLYVACPTDLILLYLIMLISSISHGPILVAARSKAWVCGLSLGGTAGSNPTGDMDVSIL
jgi:hypothetical protein